MTLTDIDHHIGSNRDLIVRLIHGENDPDIPIEHAAALHDALAAAGYDVELIPWDRDHRVPTELTAETILEAAGE
jgi:dipeptidyl aminopeptidase/acylaminoacyl peptidase